MTFGKVCAVAACAAAMIASDPALARKSGGGRAGAHHGYRHHYHHHAHRGVFFGGAAYLPLWYYYPAPVYIGAPPVVHYIERGDAPPEDDGWLYCAAASAFFPSVVDCPGGWQRVPSKPPA